ncbi:LPS-assembly protein LptD [Fluviispira multicolorata]|uniref:LPS-assembly protein LptD n=1 Tax=Fluviispira multicolorata TaxID=2654512 RepID=A0A833N3S2_9BACT|nr:hypothetical protein [Fluviispira multicolorata]KAB8030679.1 hypothetical protein GCL57_06805 [Fluviispira multicolorata]
MKNKLLRIFFIFLFHLEAYSQQPINNIQIPNLIYYDANNITLNKNEQNIILDGDATFLLGNSYLSAKKIIFQKNINLLTASGDVKLINNKQKITASKIVIDVNTKQMRMDNVKIFSDPSLSDLKVSEETLGFSKAEIAFDLAKNSRTKELENQLKSLREEYLNLKNLQIIKNKNSHEISNKINELTNKYSRLLARLTRTQYQPNAILASLPEKVRNKLIERRSAVEKFNKENPEIVNQFANFSVIKGYVKIAAAQIIQKDQETYLLNDSIITPCKCSDFNEPPIYGFSSQNTTVDVNDYITMKDVTFDLFSIPIFYSPWLKFPIKEKRETGFLIPSGYMSNNAGQAISIPFFITLGPHADSTATYEYFSERGSQFSGDFRLRLEENSTFKTEGKFIKDKINKKNWEANKNNIESAIQQSTVPITIERYQSYRGTETENRWFSNNSINIPILQSGSLKANGQFVSDNIYLSDFSDNNININPLASVYGDTSPASRRFLNQEIDTEYYGDNFVLSVRGQGLQDLFADDQSKTPIRLPRIEFNLLPDRYFNLPFTFSNETSWENVARINGSNFISIAQNSSSPQGTSIVYIPGSQRGPNDPYAKGNRLNSFSTILLPLKSNDYINANISVKSSGTQYYFPNSYPYNANQPYLGYIQYGSHFEVPMYGKLNNSSLNSQNITVTQNFTPYIDFNYIPSVVKSDNFPNTYQLWYSDDSVLSNATLTVGAKTSWTIQKESFQLSKSPILRLPSTQDLGVGNLKFFTESIKEKNLKVAPDSKGIFQFTSETEATKIFDLWAKKELNDYTEKVSSYELKQNYIWPEGNFYEKEILWSMTPLSLSIATGYNLIADKTAKEANKNAGSGVAEIPAQKYTDIITSGTLNLAPFIPIDGTVTTAYSQYYDRVNSLSLSTNANLPFGLKLSYANAQQYVLDPNNTQRFIRKTQESYGVTYLPFNWLKLNYEWAQNTDPSAPQGTDFSAGRGYASTQNISFLNLQDCLDLIFARNKPAGEPESNATYVVSLNLKLFGFEKKLDKTNW